MACDTSGLCTLPLLEDDPTERNSALPFPLPTNTEAGPALSASGLKAFPAPWICALLGNSTFLCTSQELESFLVSQCHWPEELTLPGHTRGWIPTALPCSSCSYSKPYRNCTSSLSSLPSVHSAGWNADTDMGSREGQLLKPPVAPVAPVPPVPHQYPTSKALLRDPGRTG